MPATDLSRDDDERRPLLSPHSPLTTSANRSVIHGGAVTEVTAYVRDDFDSTSFSCRHCLMGYVPIELLLFGYSFCRGVVIVLTGLYFFDQASHMYGDPSMSSLHPCGQPSGGGGGGGGDRHRAAEVQTATLKMTMIAAFSTYMTALVPTLFLGPYIDRIGRRVGFVLPILGAVSRAVVFLLVLGTGAPYYFIYIGTFLEGLGGAFGAFLMTTFSATADVTKPGRQRALRISIVEAVQVLGSALAVFVAGQWRRVSYTQPLILAASVGLLTLIFALWGMPETHTPSSSSPPTRNDDTPETRTPSSPRSTLNNAPNPPQSVVRKESEESREQEPLLSAGKRSAAWDLGEGGQSGGQGVREHVGINRDAPGEGLGGAESDGGEGRDAPASQHGYTSFSPTGHRLSALAGYQRSCREDSGPDGPRRVETIPETSPEPPRTCSLVLGNLRRSWAVYFRSGDTSHPGRRCVLLLCFVCFVLTVAVNFSKPSVESVYRLGHLCWDAVKETEFDSGWLIQHWVFILAALHILQRRLKVRAVTIAIIGSVSAMCAPLLFSVATLPQLSDEAANVLVFVSAGSGTFARVLIPMLRSMSSAVVSLDEQGSLFAGFACVELAGAAIFDLAVSQVFNMTVHVWAGIIFVIMTFFFVVVLLLLM